MDAKRVLSIQSHVVSGYVGNRAATFPLQLLGWDVDAVNTVQYSNHAGYGKFGGPKTDPTELKAIFDSMESNGVLHPSRILTGYIPSGDALKVIVEVVRKLRAKDENLIYLLDPVMGDEGRLYVNADVIPIYRDLMLPLATVITPNWYEVELLTGTKLKSTNDLRTALRILHTKYGVHSVIVSSLIMTETELPQALREHQHHNRLYTSDSIICLASSTSDSSPNISRVHTISIPQINGYFSGVGDLFSALVLAHFKAGLTDTSQTPLSQAMALAVEATHGILLRTQEHYLSLPSDERPDTDAEEDRKDLSRRPTRMRGRELRLVQSADIILKNEDFILGKPFEWIDFWTAGMDL